MCRYGFCLLLDIFSLPLYNSFSYIGQFVTILSVNKTREQMGALRPLFVCGRGLRPFFFFR